MSALQPGTRQGKEDGARGGSRSRLARGIASNWVGLVVNVAISFYLAPIVVRSLGSTWYGIWAVTIQFTGYLYLLDFGVRESVIRYTSKYISRGQGQSLNKVLTVAFGVYGPISVLTLVITAVLTWAAPDLLNLSPEYLPEARWAIVLVGLTIAQTFIFNVFTGILLGLQRWVVTNVIGVLISVSRTIIIVVLLKMGYGIIALSAVQFAVAVINGVIAWWLASRYLKDEGAAIRLVRMSAKRFRALASRVFRYGLFVFLSNIGQKIIVASDAIVIAAFMPVASVTYYAIAGSLIEPLRSLLSSTAYVFAPLASKLHAIGSREDIGKMTISGSRLILIIALPVAVTFVVLGKVFIGLWMGAEYSLLSGQVLAVLGIAVALSTPSFVIGMVLYGISRHNIAAYLKMGEAVANVALSVVLVKKYGIVGVAIGTAIPHAIVCLVIMPWLTCRAIGLPLRTYFWQTFSRPLLVTVPFVIAEVWLRSNWEFGRLIEFFGFIAALCVGYALLVYLVALDRDERAWIVGTVLRRRVAVN